MTTELIVDPAIRTWVFLPTVLIAFLIDVIRHHISSLIESETYEDLEQLKETHLVKRARLLQCNFRYIPKHAFLNRRHAFNNTSTGYLREKRSSLVQTMTQITDPEYTVDILKKHSLNLISMLLIGSWITVIFSGFLITKVPFPVTRIYQNIFQRDIELSGLEASWVSSASWYYLNAFGLKGFYGLIFEKRKKSKTSFVSMDFGATMQNTWEDLEMIEHEWALEDIEGEFGTDV